MDLLRSKLLSVAGMSKEWKVAGGSGGFLLLGGRETKVELLQNSVAAAGGTSVKFQLPQKPFSTHSLWLLVQQDCQ